MNQRGQHPGPRRSDGVPQRHGSPVDVVLGGIDVENLSQGDLLGRAHKSYQQQTLLLLGCGLVLVLIVLALRYQHPRKLLASLLPSLLAVGVTLAVLTFSGVGLDLVNVTALLFVVSMGVDYGVFLVDADQQSSTQELSAAMAGIVLAGLSTVLGFGALAFSAHPVLSSLGLTAAAGIFANLVLAPSSLVLFRGTGGDA